MESRIVTPGPYRATKLWNEITKYFRAGMPVKKHRQNLKSYGSCFTATEAVDWLHELLRNNNNFGQEVTRQQTLQLLRKFLKNHVIEDLKGRWGSENVDDDNHLYRFPTNSPLKTVPRHPLWRRSSTENVAKEKDRGFKFPHFSRRTPKKSDSPSDKENIENLQDEILDHKKDVLVHSRELSQEDVAEIWRNIVLIHLQKILGLPSLDDVLDPTQINPHSVMYNMNNTSKHGVVVLQNKLDDLPHWVLSAMKCLANWPRSNDMSQPTYVGFERDVFRTIADYFLNLPEPLVTFQYYELFVNILVVCGYLTIQNRHNGKRKILGEPCGPQPSKTVHLSNTNFFKSTECLLLSLIHKQTEGHEQEVNHVFGETLHSDHAPQEENQRQTHGYNPACSRRASADTLVGGSCQNISFTKDVHTAPYNLRPRRYSMEGEAEMSMDLGLQEGSKSPSHPITVAVNKDPFSLSGCKTESMFELCSHSGFEGPLQHRRLSANGICVEESPYEQPKTSQLCRTRSLGNCLGRFSSTNMPVSEIIVQPNSTVASAMGRQSLSSMNMETEDCSISVPKRLCQSTKELSENAFNATSSRPFTTQSCHGTQSLLQPHLEKVAVEALQLCCLLLPPPNRRKLQLLMRMISRISQNVDMPRLHDVIGTRSLMVQTFSRCVLCCAEEVDLDELLATRLVSFLMDHHQEILKVPVYLQVAVQHHIDYLKKIKYPGIEVSAMLPAYSFCKQISTQEFEEQKRSTSQAAMAELLENIIKDKALSLKDKKKKLKQFQKEYPDIYQSRFPTTESEAKLFADRPTIKQPMLTLKKPKFQKLRY
ncbi:DEP domain-containing protein 1A isoform X2 [Ambystoma mexicanum]|uniref:DEP domain-containing protein 1A isoform X2 n=1 Tax=Ambystoma mexicanum TaxID=8296 RepID=UPI0037E9429B